MILWEIWIQPYSYFTIFIDHCFVLRHIKPAYFSIQFLVAIQHSNSTVEVIRARNIFELTKSRPAMFEIHIKHVRRTTKLLHYLGLVMDNSHNILFVPSIVDWIQITIILFLVWELQLVLVKQLPSPSIPHDCILPIFIVIWVFHFLPLVGIEAFIPFWVRSSHTDSNLHYLLFIKLYITTTFNK